MLYLALQQMKVANKQWTTGTAEHNLKCGGVGGGVGGLKNENF